MLSALTYLTLGVLLARSHQRKRLKVYFLFLAVLLTFSIGITRVYLGVHYPSDILAGWSAAIAWVFGIHQFVVRKAPPPPPTAAPAEDTVGK